MAENQNRPPELTTRSVEFRATSDGESDGRTLEGYAAVFGADTEIRSFEGSFTESIAPGAFDRSLGERMPVIQFDHGHDARTGSVPIGSFEDIREDEHGLFVRARLFENDLVEPIRQAIEGRAISGMSFAFRVRADEWVDGKGKRIADRDLPGLLVDARGRGPIRRVIRDVDLFEAGPVVFPAYDQTSVGVRSQEISADAEEVEPEADPAPAEDSERKGDTVTEQRLTLAERRGRITEIESELHELAEEYEGRSMDEGASGNWTRLTEELEGHRKAVKETEERAAMLASLKTGERAEVDGMAVQRTAPSNPGVVVRKGVQSLDEIRNSAFSADDYREKVRDNAYRAAESARFGMSVKADEAREQVDHLLRNVDGSGKLAERVSATANPVYERAFGKALMAGTPAVLMGEEARALQTGSDPDGGYAVPFTLDPTVILTNAGSVNPLRQVARVIQITGNEWRGVTSAGITVSRAAEAAEVADGSPTLAQPSITPSRVHGFVPFSVEAGQDWTALRSEMATLLQDAKDQEEAGSFATGDGVAPNPEGVVTGAGQTFTPAAGSDSITAAMVYELEEMLGPRFRASASFLSTKAGYNDVRQDTAAEDQLWERIGAGQPNQLLGYAARELSTLPTPALSADGTMLFGDFSQFAIVDRVGMSVELVPHLFGANNRPTGQRGLYAIWRNSSQVLVPDAVAKIVHPST